MNQTPLVEDIQNYAQDIVDPVHEPLWILDSRIAQALRRPAEGFQYQKLLNSFSTGAFPES